MKEKVWTLLSYGSGDWEYWSVKIFKSLDKASAYRKKMVKDNIMDWYFRWEWNDLEVRADKLLGDIAINWDYRMEWDYETIYYNPDEFIFWYSYYDENIHDNISLKHMEYTEE
jgi:hypothetical protein